MHEYKENGILTKTFTIIIAVLVWAGIIWGEFGGLYHSFKHFGFRDGLVAAFVPPYSWYRSVHFFFWLNERGKIEKYFTKLIEINKKYSDEILNKEDMKKLYLGSREELMGVIYERYSILKIWIADLKQIDVPKNKNILSFHNSCIKINEKFLESLRNTLTTDDVEVAFRVYIEDLKLLSSKLSYCLDKYDLSDKLAEKFFQSKAE